MLQPQNMGIFHVISGLTQAEGTGTWTFIGEIYIDIIVYFIENRHFFFHNAAFLSVCF